MPSRSCFLPGITTNSICKRNFKIVSFNNDQLYLCFKNRFKIMKVLMGLIDRPGSLEPVFIYSDLVSYYYKKDCGL